jgi:hypothetical protein
MRQTLIAGLAAAAAFVTMSAAPAMACGGYYASGCSPCGQAYVAPSPCGGFAVGGYYGYGVAEFERLPDPSPQYFYVDQGPSYSGPGMFAPRPYYREATASRWNGYGHGYRHAYHHRQFHGWNGGHRFYGAARPNVRYGHAARHSYGPRYGSHHTAPRGYGPHKGHHPY